MIWLIQDFDFFSVLLRALALSLEALTVGGVFFLLFVGTSLTAEPAARNAVRGFVAWFALALAITQVLAAAESTVMLMSASGPGLAFRDVIAASFFRANFIMAAGALALFLLLRLRRGETWAACVLATAILGGSVALSHAASRIDHRPLLLLLTAAHHLGAAAWMGGMASLLVAIRRSEDALKIHIMARRFSVMAIVSVSVLVLAGVGMTFFYVGSWSGMYGTSYGFMVLTKAYLLLLALTLGASNFWLVRRTRSDTAPVLLRLRRFSEAEIGLGFTAILAAASLTSQPPAIDLIRQDVLTGPEIVARMSLQQPKLHSPSIADLPPRKSLKEHLEDASFSGGSENDLMNQRWSEYNHQWSGLIVLSAGLLALVSRFRGQRWARNWPLLFFGLAIFLFLRADPETWPLGARPFWASFAESDVLEHRLFVVLITAFVVFEWAVETGRLKAHQAALVFPAICALGGALLLTHSHGTGNLKGELYAEMSHSPIALLGATAGWGRWLELRSPQDEDMPDMGSRIVRIASWIWPICLVLVGLILLNYRES
ncbi:MAG TPA: CopD family protein [Silvibacterium sp.]|nr:CopD family protein [Silvibacterium sp.]